MRSALDVPHLELLIAVADNGSLNGAASELGVTQPALTYRLREAERRLGAPLFVKGRGRRLRMTPSAERLLPSARRVLAELAHAERDIHRFAGGIRYVVKVGVEGQLCPPWLPLFVKFLGERAGEITVELVPDALQDPTGALTRGTVDMAIGYGSAVPQGWRSFELYGDTLVVALPADHDLTARSSIGARDFAEQTYVTPGPAVERAFGYQAVLEGAGVAPGRILKAASLDGALAYVAAGLGLTLVGARDVARWQTDGRVVVRPLDRAPVEFVWWAAARPDEHGGSPAFFVADHLSLWCQEIMPNLNSDALL